MITLVRDLYFVLFSVSLTIVEWLHTYTYPYIYMNGKRVLKCMECYSYIMCAPTIQVIYIFNKIAHGECEDFLFTRFTRFVSHDHSRT